MAKTKDEKQGLWSRQCPSCKKWNHHRAVKCANCGAVMPGAAKTTKAKSGTVPVSEPSAPATLAQGIAKAEDFIAVAGGIERAKKLLAICEQDAKDWAQKTK